MSTLTLRLEMVNASVMSIASVIPVALFSGIARFGVDVFLAVVGGVVVPASKLLNVIDWPAGEICSIVRFDDVPFHHVLSGTDVSAKRASGPAKRSPGSPTWFRCRSS